MKRHLLFPFLIILMTLSACEPEVGSDAWCEKIAEKPKGDLTINELGEFASNCVFKSYENDK